jgi:hypothetical protein
LISTTQTEEARRSNALHLSKPTQQRIRLVPTRNELEPLDELLDDVEWAGKTAVGDEEEGDELFVCEAAKAGIGRGRSGSVR